MKIKCQNECPEKRFDGCCHGGCPHAEDCPEKCGHEPKTCGESTFEGGELEVFQTKAATVIEKISSLVQQKAAIETAEKEMREQLQAAMEAHGIKKFDTDIIRITYVEASSRSGVDGAKLKKNYPDIHAECTKTSAVKAFVKIELKGGEKK